MLETLLCHISKCTEPLFGDTTWSTDRAFRSMGVERKRFDCLKQTCTCTFRSTGGRSVSVKLSRPSTSSKSRHRFASILLHFDTFLSRSEQNHIRTQMHLPETVADLLPDGFIWTPFCPDLDQAIFEPMNTFQKLSAFRSTSVTREHF